MPKITHLVNGTARIEPKLFRVQEPKMALILLLSQWTHCLRSEPFFDPPELSWCFKLNPPCILSKYIVSFLLCWACCNQQRWGGFCFCKEMSYVFSFCFSSSLSLFSQCKRYHPSLLPLFLRDDSRSVVSGELLDRDCWRRMHWPQWVEARNAAEPSVMYRIGPQNSYLAPNVNSAELEKPWAKWCLSSLFSFISHFLYSGLSPRHLHCLLFSWDSKCGPWTSSICITQELVGNGEIWVC